MNLPYTYFDNGKIDFRGNDDARDAFRHTFSNAYLAMQGRNFLSFPPFDWGSGISNSVASMLGEGIEIGSNDSGTYMDLFKLKSESYSLGDQAQDMLERLRSEIENIGMPEEEKPFFKLSWLQQQKEFGNFLKKGMRNL